jgi:polysaccharide biosynthesis protein PslH
MQNRSRLKILWISHFLPYPPRGGALIRSYHLLTQLAKHHDVDLVTFSQKALVTSYASSYETGIENATSELNNFVSVKKIIHTSNSRIQKLINAAIALISGQPYTIRHLISKSATSYFQNQIDWDSYDVIHVDTISLVPYLPPTSKIKMALNHHNIESHMMERRANRELNPIKSWYFRLEANRLKDYERKHSSRFFAHLVCSEVDKERLAVINPTIKIEVIPNGVSLADVPYPANREPATPPRLIFIGGLDWYPNKDAVVHFLKEIWPHLKSENIELHIVGKNPPSDLIELTSGISKIHIHGFVQDISAIYREAAIYICPIRDGGGTKLKVLDALGHGLPLVGYPEACEGISVQNGVHARIVENPMEFAHAIVSMIKESESTRKLGEEGERLIRREYDVESIGKKLADLYSSEADGR